MTESETYHAYEGKRVVIVASDEYMRQAIRSFVCLITDIDIDIYVDGEHAREALTHDANDVYLLIVQTHLDVVNGLELVRAIRCGNTDAPRELPVVVFGPECGDPKLRDLAQRLDVNVYIEQPISYMSIMNALLRAARTRIRLVPSSTYALINTDIVDKL